MNRVLVRTILKLQSFDNIVTVLSDFNYKVEKSFSLLHNCTGILIHQKIKLIQHEHTLNVYPWFSNYQICSTAALFVQHCPNRAKIWHKSAASSRQSWYNLQQRSKNNNNNLDPISSIKCMERILTLKLAMYKLNHGEMNGTLVSIYLMLYV